MAPAATPWPRHARTAVVSGPTWSPGQAPWLRREDADGSLVSALHPDDGPAIDHPSFTGGGPVSTVPEPGTRALVGTRSPGVAGMARRRVRR